jgi:hypothetical protein
MNPFQRILLLCVVFGAASLKAQPVFTVSDLPSNPGTVVHYGWTSGAVTVDLGLSGPNRTWNFTNMTTTYDYSTTWLLPGQTPFAPAFPTANRATLKSDGPGYNEFTYYNVTSSSVQLLGFVTDWPGQIDTMTYEGGNIIYNFPLSYGNQWSTVFHIPVGFPGYTVTDSIHYNVDGWGTLIDNTGTYPCLRVQAHSLTYSYYNGIPTDTTSGWTYTWVVAGRGGQAYISSLSDETNPNFTTGQYGRVNDVLGVQPLPDPIVMPTGIELTPAYPNPFNATTVLTFTLPHSGEVTLSIFDAAGRQVRDLAKGNYLPGAYQVTVDGAGLPSGTYFARLTANGFETTRSMTLLK